MRRPTRDPRLTPGELEGLDEYDYFWALMEPGWDGPETGTAGQRRLAVITYFVRDATNGGISQAIGNRDCEEFAEVLSALEAIGAAEHLGAARRAEQMMLGPEPPRLHSERRAMMEQRCQGWDNELLDALALPFEDEESLHPHFRAYIEANPTEFFREESPSREG